MKLGKPGVLEKSVQITVYLRWLAEDFLRLLSRSGNPQGLRDRFLGRNTPDRSEKIEALQAAGAIKLVGMIYS